MKVKELIEELQIYQDDLEVIIHTDQNVFRYIQSVTVRKPYTFDFENNKVIDKDNIVVIKVG